MKGSSLQITMFVEWIITRVGKAELPLQLWKVSPIIM
jgi:hypothetical protein